MERTGFEAPSPVELAEWILVLSHQAMNWSQCLLKLMAHPVTSVAYDSKSRSGFEDWLSGGNRAMCVSACEGGGQS